MADYCALSDIYAQLPESGLGTASAADYDPALAAYITIASRAIDREVGRWDDYFCSPIFGTTRYYDGNGGEELWVDEFLSLSELAVSENGGQASGDYTVWGAGDYIVAPYNAPDIGQPYQRLIVDTLNGDKLHFSRHRRNVRLTGVFGYSFVPPAPVKQACIIQVVRWHIRAKQMYQDTGAGAQFAQYSVSGQLDPDVARLIAPYKSNGITEMG